MCTLLCEVSKVSNEVIKSSNTTMLEEDKEEMML